MVKKMQVEHFRGWLLIVVNWMAALVGLQVVSIDRELVQEGWRQIPSGHQSFDPALADYFKSQKMRNGKHINLAVSYSVVAKWNSSNKRRGQSEWTYGSDRHYAANYTDVDRKTWGQHMDELVTLGLVVTSQIKGKPAYKAVPYQILNAQLQIIHAPDYGHDAQKVARDAQGYGHDAHPITESSHKELSGNGIDLKPAAAPREDAAAGISNAPIPETSLDEKPMPPVMATAAAADDSDFVVSDHAVTTASIPPVALPPLSPVDDDCPEDAPADLKEFFNGCRQGELELMIATYGETRIRAVIDEVRTQSDVRTPPGLVIAKLRLGAQGAWKWPISGKAAYAEGDGSRYVTGEYARFIKH